MRHCPRPECPHAASTGRAAEYEDHVAYCADCGTKLIDGPAPGPSPDKDALQAIAKFSTPHEAHIARASLASHGITAVVDQDHTPYISASSWVQLRVAPTDAELAREVLEQGPVQNADESTQPDSAGPSIAAAPAVVDDMRPSRLSRRMLLARWFLYAEAIVALLAGLHYLAGPIVAIVPFGLALWSKRQPRPAFSAALGFQTLATLVSVATTGLAGLGALIPNLAVYFAWLAAGEKPPDHILAEPEATRSVEGEIGEAWKDEGAPPEVTSGPSIRWKRILGVALVAVAVLVAGGLLRRSPLVQRLILGSTEFRLEADTDAAVRQELELGRARLAMELGRSEIAFSSIEISGSGASASIVITGILPGATEAFNEILLRLFPGWTIDGDPSAALRVTPGAEARSELIDDALGETLADLREQQAITISSVDRRTEGSILLQAKIPGRRSIEEIRELVVSPARLEMKRVRYPPGVDDTAGWYPPKEREDVVQLFGGRLPAGTELVVQPVGQGFSVLWPVESVPVVVGRDLVDVRATIDGFADPCITFLLTQEAGRRLEAASSQTIGRKMVLILRDDHGAHVVTAPVIEGTISTEGIIRGGFSESEASSMCDRMRAGARAMPLRVIDPLDDRTR